MPGVAEAGGHGPADRAARLNLRLPRARGRTIAIEGASGVGKTTIAAALAIPLGAELVPEAYDLIEPRPSLSFSTPAELERLELGLLRTEVERFRRAERLRRAGRTVVLDTGFLGPLTYTAGVASCDARFRRSLDAVAGEVERLVRSGRLGIASEIVYLDLDPSAASRRGAASPDSHPLQWRDRHEAVGRWERRLWTRVFPRLATGRLRVVRAIGPPSRVLGRILDRIGRRPPMLPMQGPAAVRTVRRFARLPRAPMARGREYATRPSPRFASGNR